jgi:rhodanese-related sulfurtransferase
VSNPLSAVDFFAAHLAFQTDPADLAADRAAGRSPLVLDVRSDAAWAQGHLPGAVHLPGPLVRDRVADVVPDRDAAVVVHCWGPGCNGATRAALVLATLGYTGVRELLGGYEYWVREGFAVVTATGRVRRAPDPLTAPGPAC